ncbi:MAG: TonB-dependent receptor [Gammaproteobacteria bacterium]|jgi:iron complex outermembrane receptor protein|nr:TonB-dependent receptor [Gammaproteobacteria bacterium]
MSKKSISYGALALVLGCSGLTFQSALAQDDEMIEEVITIGSRSMKPRSASDSTVPIDVISADDFSSVGSTADLTDNLKALIPSYTATPATGDGSAFVRPTSLRGTAPDQSLVLVDGKRRHRSALVQFFAPAAGNGAHGADVGMIPGIAVKSVEVLRDGASSQYGSDAIAGVINFVMKDASEGGSVQVTYGEHYEGEQSTKLAANAGFALGDSGFANVSLEYVDNDGLSRGIQRTSNYDALIDLGVDPSVIGADAPFGDAPLLQSWGRPETEGIRFFLNSGFDISDTSEIYARFSAAETDGRYRFFYRTYDHSTLAPLRDMGFTGLPAGYTPFLDGNQQDASLVLGMRGEFDNGMLYDVSYGYGKDELSYYLNNTVNVDLGLDDSLNIPQMGFDMGGYIQEENNFNLDFSLPISDSVNLAFGAEAREEKFSVIAGEPAATFRGGPSGMTASRPAEAGEFTRDNIAIYADVEHDVSDALLMQYAIRYENFSDFGPTTNAKIAGRYRVSDTLAFRGAVSTGFHAPTPGQANVRTTITTFDGSSGLQQEEQLVAPTSSLALENGGAPLTEEKSLNFSIGFASDIFDNWTLTADYYRIEVSDRIYRVGDITIDDPLISSISFYTNALDVSHQGIDLVVTGGIGDNTDLTFAYAFNQISVDGQSLINGIPPVSDGTVEDIENNYPEHRFTLSANTQFTDKLDLMARATYYGEHYDERGTIGAAVDPSAKIGSTIYLDMELGFQATDSLRVALGAVNILDEFVDTIGPPNANRLSVGLQYPRRSAANYEGGSWYLKGIYSFQ